MRSHCLVRESSPDSPVLCGMRRCGADKVGSRHFPEGSDLNNIHFKQDSRPLRQTERIMRYGITGGTDKITRIALTADFVIGLRPQ